MTKFIRNTNQLRLFTELKEKKNITKGSNIPEDYFDLLKTPQVQKYARKKKFYKDKYKKG